MNNVELNAQLRTIRQSLPHGSSFQYRLSDDSLYLESLQLPSHARDQQGAVLEQIVAAADSAELPVELHIAPAGRPGLTVQALENMGFEGMGEEEEGLFMRRRVSRPDVDWNQVQDVEAVLESARPRRRRMG